MKSKGGPSGGGSNIPQQVSKSNPENHDLNQKYKTSLCRHFENLGKCDLADKCHFAHGKDELRKASDVKYFV
jgi:Zinc finger C-x8-C-x5-C-x3-H type (and similar)